MFRISYYLVINIFHCDSSVYQCLYFNIIYIVSVSPNFVKEKHKHMSMVVTISAGKKVTYSQMSE